MKRSFALLLALSLCWQTMQLVAEQAGKFRTPDFNFPMEVDTHATAMLDSALRRGDDHTAVMALTQISLARTVVSSHQATQVKALIDSVLSLKQLSPDHCALLYLLEARMISAIKGGSGDDSIRDIALWSQMKRERLVDELYLKVMDPMGNGDHSPLFQPIERYEGILCMGNSWGQRCVPTLFDYLVGALQGNVDSKYYNALCMESRRLHRRDANPLPAAYLDFLKEVPSVRIYREHGRKEELGLFLCLREPNANAEKEVIHYLKHYPSSPFAPQLTALKARFDKQRVQVFYTDLLTSTDSIVVMVENLRADSCRIHLYRIPDSVVQGTNEMIQVSDLQRIESLSVRQRRHGRQKVSFAPQPYGRYIVLPSIMTDEGEKQESHIERLKLENQQLRISDLRTFYVASNQGHKLFALRAADGTPIEGANIDYRLYNLRPIEPDESGIADSCQQTDADGCVALGPYDYCRYSVSQGTDSYLPQKTAEMPRLAEKRTEAQIFTDLAIYRPGDTLQAVVLLIESDNATHRPKAGQQVDICLVNVQGKVIDRQPFTTDEYGEATCRMAIPTKGLNGLYSLKVESDNTIITGRRLIEVSEYKLPNFVIDLSATPSHQASKHRAVIEGDVINYTGMPVAHTEVKGELRESFFFRKKNARKFTVKSDSTGHFRFVCPRRWTHRRRFGYYQVKATCTDAAGETEKSSSALTIGTFSLLSLLSNNLLIGPDTCLQLPIKVESTDEGGKQKNPRIRYWLYQYRDWEAETLLGEWIEEYMPRLSYHYSNWKQRGKRVKRGSFRADKPEVDWQDIPSQVYIFKAKARGVNGEIKNRKLTLYRMSDLAPIEKRKIWAPKDLQQVTEEGVAHISVGSSYAGSIYYIATDREGEVASGWLQLQPGMKRFDIQIPPKDDNYLDVHFFALHEGLLKTTDLHLTLPKKNRISLRTVSFRDKVTPGGVEHWRFALVDSEGKPLQGRMMLELYSKALEDLKSNQWSLDIHYPWQEDLKHSRNEYRSDVENKISYTYIKPIAYFQTSLQRPILNLYGQDFLRQPRKTVSSTGPKAHKMVNGYVYSASDNEPIIGVSIREVGTSNGTCTDADGYFSLDLLDRSHLLTIGFIGFNSQTVKPAEYLAIHLQEDVCALEEVTVVGYGVQKKFDLTGAVAGISTSNIKVRGIASESLYGAQAPKQKPESKIPSLEDIKTRLGHVKVALWQPILESDSFGNFTLDFKVADENTTWSLQAMAFTQRLASDMMHTEVVAQRPVMVQPSLPRFLRTGDQTPLMANVMNATDSLLQVKAQIEIFDPRTGESLSSETHDLTLEARATECLAISCQPALDATSVGYRVKALAADGSGDGEQQLIPVLPHVAPVVEALPFVLTPQDTLRTLEVPWQQQEGTMRLTLEYCDNPAWYALQALPTLATEEAITSTGLAHQLYALAVATQLRQNLGIDSLSNLKSALSSNESIKINQLENSPWLTAAELQARRNEALSHLLNETTNRKEMTRIVQKLKSMQLQQGGLMWAPSKHHTLPSLWATTQVVELLGDLHRLGTLPQDVELKQLLREALFFLDSTYAGQLRLDAGCIGRLELLPYLYVRSQFGDSIGYENDSIAATCRKIEELTLQALQTEWTTLPMDQRAYAALTLARLGQRKTAVRILESMRQLALHDPVRGMYWEQINRNAWFHPVACTALLLQAFAEIAPDEYADCIREMRQWLLLEKQTSDWGNGSLTAHAVHSLLMTGEDWLQTSNDSLAGCRILVDGSPVEDPSKQNMPANDIASRLGYQRIDLPATARQITLSRHHTHPAWGAIFHQYVAPLNEIKADSVEELAVRKELMVQEEDGQWKPLPLDADGTPMLKVGQRVQVRFTITCNKNLEYVTLRDDRPACLEPVDKTSGSRWTQEGSYYFEVKDDRVHLFFDRIRSGAFTLSYECYVSQSGTFSCGTATIQSQQAPQMVAHSKGGKVVVES